MPLPLPLRGIRDRLVARWASKRAAAALGPARDLLPVSLSTVYGDAVPPRALHRMARGVFEHMAMNTLDYRRMARGERVRLRNAPALDAPARQGKGAVVCGFHLGPFRYVAVETARRRPGTLVFTAGHLARSEGEDWARNLERLGIDLEILPLDRPGSMVRAFRALSRGSYVVIFTDGANRLGGRDADPGHVVDLTFLSLPMRMSLAPAELARRAGVPLVWAVTRRDRWARLAIELAGPVPPPRDPGESRAATRKMYAWFEEFARRHPEQWDGWLSHVLLWRESGAAPKVSAGAWSKEAARIRELLERGSRERLVAEPAHTAVVRREGGSVILHGPSRRILKAGDVSCRLVEAALEGVPLARLPERTGLGAEELGREIARLVLADLARVG